MNEIKIHALLISNEIKIHAMLISIITQEALMFSSGTNFMDIYNMIQTCHIPHPHSSVGYSTKND